jgi:hypothetical protein
LIETQQLQNNSGLLVHRIRPRKRQLIRNLLNSFRRRFAGPVARARFDADEHRRVAGVGALQGGGELKRMAGDDAIVGVGRGDEDCPASR